ncbi:BlaI/MecI/CopY family transcriptional regulator [Kitasatospora sp. NPDC056531]|uniref:BlaI/MecI/CopY family transcriptional regulator n=1 Tax=Kitasatospora sp. NPDC056531 TaxID=3345856 RepID=UPI00369F44C0
MGGDRREQRRDHGALEAEVMGVLWAEGQPMTAAQVHEALGDPGLVYKTVLTVLGRLYGKGRPWSRSVGFSTSTDCVGAGDGVAAAGGGVAVWDEAGGVWAGAVRGGAGVAGTVGEAEGVLMVGAVGAAVEGGAVTAVVVAGGGLEGWVLPPLSASQAEAVPSAVRMRTAIPTALCRCMR